MLLEISKAWDQVIIPIYCIPGSAPTWELVYRSFSGASTIPPSKGNAEHRRIWEPWESIWHLSSSRTFSPQPLPLPHPLLWSRYVERSTWPLWLREWDSLQFTSIFLWLQHTESIPCFFLRSDLGGRGWGSESAYFRNTKSEVWSGKPDP